MHLPTQWPQNIQENQIISYHPTVKCNYQALQMAPLTYQSVL